MVEKWYRFSGLYWILFLLFLIFYIRYISIDEYRNSVIIKGKVIRGLEGVKKARRNRYPVYPQYEFLYKDSIYYNADEGFSFYRFGLGEEVKIIFPKDDPGNSRIYTFVSFWFHHVSLFYCAVFGLLIFAAPLIVSRIYHDITSRS